MFNIGEEVKVEFNGIVTAIELRDNKVLFTIVENSKIYPRAMAAFIQEGQLVSLKEMDLAMESQYNENH